MRLSVAVPLLTLALAAAAASPARAEDVTVPSGTMVEVRIESDLSSDEAREGDTFRTTVLTPVTADGRERIPAGSTVEGVVTTVKSRLGGRRSGVLGLHFTRLHTPDGRKYDIDGGLVGFRKLPLADGDLTLVKAPGKRSVVVIGNEVEGPGKRPSSLVSDSDETEGALAERWSRSGLSPNLAYIEKGAEITFELRKSVTVQQAAPTAR